MVSGRYGHTVQWDDVNNMVLIHGGLVASVTTSTVVNELLGYDPREAVWYILPPSPASVYLHSSAVLGAGSMVLFGGNSHNDTSVSHSARCYTHSAWVYDTVCGTWQQLPLPHAKGI